MFDRNRTSTLQSLPYLSLLDAIQCLVFEWECYLECVEKTMALLSVATKELLLFVLKSFQTLLELVSLSFGVLLVEWEMFHRVLDLSLLVVEVLAMIQVKE